MYTNPFFHKDSGYLTKEQNTHFLYYGRFCKHCCCCRVRSDTMYSKHNTSLHTNNHKTESSLYFAIYRIAILFTLPKFRVKSVLIPNTADREPQLLIAGVAVHIADIVV